MLVATWVLAVATAILALSGPVALLAWLGARRSDRERRQREHEGHEADRILQTARGEFLSKSTAGGWVALGALAGVLAWATWSERKDQRPTNP